MSQFIDRRTRSERAVVVEVCERGGAKRTDVDAVEGVLASGSLHERRRRRRPSVLQVFERVTSQYEVQVACGRHKTCCHSLSVDGHGLSVPSLSKSVSAGALEVPPRSMPSKGFTLPVLATKTGAVDVPVFSK